MRSNSLRFSLAIGLVGLLGYGCMKTDSQPEDHAVAGGGAGGTAGGGAHDGGASGSSEPDAAGAGGSSDSSAGTAGVSDAGGAAGEAGSSAGGEAGSSGSNCGELGQACCAASCHNGLVCLGSNSVCSCASALSGAYVIRTDGALLAEASKSQVAVINVETSAPLSPVANVQDGYSHGCAAVADSHSAWCWAVLSDGNASGQLGNGSTSNSAPLFQATQVLKAANQPLTNVASIASGASDIACAVLNDGTVYCWGDVTQVLNGGTTLHSGYALRVTLDGTTPLTGVKQLVLGASHACALVEASAANEVWCWGYDRGNLGLGTATGNGNSQYPKKIAGLPNPTQIAIANGGPLYSTTCVQDGANVRCWGNNNNQGSVGVSSSTGTFVATPTLVTTSASGGGVLDEVVELQSGTHGNAADFCVRRSDRTVWCWGSGFTPYASPYLATDVAAIGWAGDPRFLTGDGVYHLGTTARELNCGKL
ncbi:MAG TPA: hypothetical protein VER96_23595 [Polyangiaceae bacterium]|nr:hypothetical protein [Polyangiaceae bacterium]